VAEMSNDHLTNIIKDMSGRMESWFEQIIVKELEHRDINNIIVPD
jgi:ribosomal protein L12E/L44/L45/RPP1/RPP2